MRFWGEMRRRNVCKVSVAYLVVAWLIIQIGSIVLPTFAAPAWVMPTITFVLVIMLPVVLIVAWAFEITPEGIKKTASVPLEQSITDTTGQRLNYVVTALLAIAVLVLVIDNYVLDDMTPAGSSSQATAALPTALDNPLPTAPSAQAAADTAGLVDEPAPLPNSIAVIPFTNMSPNDDDAYFAAGIHEEILNQLAKLGSLNVIARTSVIQYAGTQKPIPEIARELNVEAVMEGSVRYAGGQVLVTTQLIDAATNVHLWSESYQREFSDIFGIQSDIAMNVANALRAEYSPEEQASIEALPTTSIDAYDHYLLAQSLMRQGFSGSQDQSGPAALRAIEEYERAIELDPNFSLARLGLAQNMGFVSLIAGNDPEFAARTRAAIDAAIELTDELPAALGLVASRNSGAHQWGAAEETYLEWLERAPTDDYGANLAYGSFLMNVGRAREAVPYLELARRIDPLLAGPSIELTMAYDALGDTERAIMLHARMENLIGYDFRAAAPQFWRVLLRDGEESALEAIASGFGVSSLEEMREFLAAAPDAPNAIRAFKIFEANLGDPAAGRAALRETYADPTSETVAAMLNIALLAAYYGDTDLSAGALAKAARPFALGSLQFAWTPLMREVRRHPEFKALLIELGLPEYWREAGWPEHCRPLGTADFECS